MTSDKHKAKVAELEEQLAQAKTAELRAHADYQNLRRRTEEERIKIVKFASRELAAALLQPLDHLDLAVAHLKDKGLEMTVQHLWQTLKDHGLTTMEVVGQPFDPLTMEVVDKEGEGEVVTKEVKKGYLLNGEVIQHAKVIVG